MPFIGRDWRSPGEAWVKTESLGWQRMKIIESQLYPTCHQGPSCSWPPRSDYGQHMNNHRRADCADDRRSGKLDPGKPDMRTGPLGDSNAASPASSSSCSSAASSRGGSLSPSPSSSPEKNNHRIHPIAISSPYGWHSCSNHRSATAANCCAENCHHYQHAPSMPRSLSKESLVSGGNNFTANSTTMRYNRSASDLRDPLILCSEHRALGNDNNSDRSEVDEKGCIVSPPALMKDGQRIQLNDELSNEVGRSSSKETNNAVSAPELDTKQSQQSHKSCCCCCTIADTITGGTGISVRTREVVMYNTISEAFYRLDFCNAIHDIRRFNYICKLLHLLITQNLTSLSGCATRVLFSMLEQVAWEVSNNKRNVHILKNLLKELRQMIEKYYCWGRPIGSSLLWQQHFETIERISQIVEAIELAPPKGTIDKASFNDLPAEMIREILLRLNDYRDLVNSAQASPVMQIMIDNQYIWQKLCKYHFSEQQLKIALENRSNYQLPAPIKQRTNNAKGLKYARTSSADGRSYRNPMGSSLDTPTSGTKSKKKEAQSSTSSADEQKSNQCNPTELDSHQGRRRCSSYVTRAIRIFDREGSSTDLGTGLVRRNQLDVSKNIKQQSQANHRYDSNRLQSRSGSANNNKKFETSKATQQQVPDAINSRPTSSPAGREINWERVFHQLRKKFDLKEEYPDCLLLCRHCRCLFWKSFGHPCIRPDDIRLDAPLERNQNPLATDQRAALQQVNMAPTADRSAPRGGRPSVADLSRNFSGPRLAPRDNGADAGSNVENVQPAQASAPFRDSDNGIGKHRLMSANLDDAARLLRARRPIINAQGFVRENNSGNISSQRTSSSTKRGDELIPKHVAISPQAFLKFFSL